MFDNCAEAYAVARYISAQRGQSLEDVFKGEDWLVALPLFEELLVLNASIRALALDRTRGVGDKNYEPSRRLRNEALGRIAAVFEINADVVLGLKVK